MKSKVKIVTGTLTRRTIDLVKDGSIDVVVSEPAIVFGRGALQYTVRILNGDPLPKLVPGIMPYPVALVPNVALTKANSTSTISTNTTCRRRAGVRRSCNRDRRRAAARWGCRRLSSMNDA